ncbi:hypothetical protein GCM10023231_02760 [Olivibacter ginsenosidimutans]|uniref:Uncharacterized protein n=1 Tax=Olivibacter ginsenosidimutans TaxID=1176537 RepID=A0ABP9AG48_9SPHI
MDENNKKNIPKSTIKGSGFVNINWNGEKSGSLMYSSSNCILLGKEDVPYMLYTTPNIVQLLAAKKGEGLYKIRKLVLTSFFGSKTNSNNPYTEIPEWIGNFQELQEIYFENINVDRLEIVKSLYLTKLSFKNVTFRHISSICRSINGLSMLEEIHHDESFHDVLLCLDKRIKTVNII